MNPIPLNVLLADDDKDDCTFFKEALEEIPVSTKLEIVNGGVQLMDLLSKSDTVLPDVLFLDLNMPRKNGFESLAEIKSDKKLREIPVIIFTTSFNPAAAEQLQQMGAKYYIQKPPEFHHLRDIIQRTLGLIMHANGKQNEDNVFFLNPS